MIIKPRNGEVSVSQVRNSCEEFSTLTHDQAMKVAELVVDLWNRDDLDLSESQIRTTLNKVSTISDDLDNVMSDLEDVADYLRKLLKAREDADR